MNHDMAVFRGIAFCISEFKARVLCFRFQLDMREQLSITDYKGKEIGYLNVSMVTRYCLSQIQGLQPIAKYSNDPAVVALLTD